MMPCRFMWILAFLFTVQLTAADLSAGQAPVSSEGFNHSRNTGDDLSTFLRRCYMGDALTHVRLDMSSIRQRGDGSSFCVNPGQGLNVDFPAAGGFTLSRPGSDWRIGLNPLGRGEVEEKIVDSANRFENHFADGFIEWFVNGDDGLEHGFTIHQPVAGELEVRLAVSGGSARLDGKGVSLYSEDGAHVVDYDKLMVFDAAKKSLPAEFAVKGDSLSIVVNTDGAEFPVTIDPLATAADWTDEGENVNAYFGSAVSSAGDVNGDGYSDVIIGSNGYYDGGDNVGKAYVFHGSASGIAAAASWSATGEADSNYFALSVAAAGDVNGDGYADVVIGAQGYDGVAGLTCGKAYVFHGSASGITGDASSPAWSMEGENAGDGFGCEVAGAGDVNGDGYSDIIVGAKYYNGAAGDDTGKVYVFEGSTTGLEPAAEWHTEGEVNDDYFGSALAGAGDVNGDGYSDIIVGTKYYDGAAGAGSGKAYVFKGSFLGITGTAAGPYWSAEGAVSGDYFGNDVDTAGDINGDGYSDVIVGAQRHDGPGGIISGAAYVFNGSSGGIAAAESWSVTGADAGDTLGDAVACAGDFNGDGYSDVLVGAGGCDGGGNASGRAYAFKGSISGVVGDESSPYWAIDGENESDGYGESLAWAGDVNGDGFSDILIGAGGYDGAAGSNSGKAYAYYGGGDGLSGEASNPAWSAAGQNADDNLGSAVVEAGDVNGDGFGDIIVGVYKYNGVAGAASGKVYVFHGSVTGVTGTSLAPAWSFEGEAAGDNFGVSVSGAGDVNGDGYGDIVVGASGATADTGKVYVFHGSSSGIAGAAAWSSTGEGAGNYFGDSVSVAGDVNGDGYSDIVVGAYGFGSSAGKVYVFQGSSSGITGDSAAAAWAASGVNVGDEFGLSVSCAGDVNGDGYGDILVGAPSFDGSGADAGKAYVFEGSASGVGGTPLSPAWSTTGQMGDDYFGYSVSNAGDYNTDGYGDIIVGAFGYDGVAGGNSGKTYAFNGSSAGITGNAGSPAWSFEGFGAGDLFGKSVSTAGDVNGDGYADIIIGAERFDGLAGSNSGCAHVFRGSASGLAAAESWSVTGEAGNDYFGAAVSTAGDVNGDGFSDALAGAVYHTGPGGAFCGKAYVFQGCGGRGKKIKMTVCRLDDSIIQGWSGRGAPDKLKINAWNFSVIGRVDYKLKAQALVKGKSWTADSGDIVEAVSASWGDTGTTGAASAVTITGLTPETYYQTRCRTISSGVLSPQPAGPWHYIDALSGGDTATPARGFRWLMY